MTGHRTSISVNSWDTSISKSEQTSDAVSPATIANLSSGEFVGILSDDPDYEMALKAFHAKIVRDAEEMDIGELQPLPVVREVTAEMVEENFQRVKKDILIIVNEEMKRILADPVLAGRVVK